MNEYFAQFPLINYDGKNIIDITRRSAIIKQVVGDRYAFYPYHVKDGMRAEIVAQRYYGDQDLVWLVYLSNDIIDPYHQWPKSDIVLNQFIIDTYGSLESANEKVVFYRVNWASDNTILSVDEYNDLPAYEKKYWEATLDQYNYPSNYVRKQIDYTVVAQDGNGNITSPISIEEQKYWQSVTAYDVEIEENAKKANIRLLDNRLVSTVVSNLKSVMSQ